MGVEECAGVCVLKRVIVCIEECDCVWLLKSVLVCVCVS